MSMQAPGSQLFDHDPITPALLNVGAIQDTQMAGLDKPWCYRRDLQLTESEKTWLQ